GKDQTRTKSTNNSFNGPVCILPCIFYQAEVGLRGRSGAGLRRSVYGRSPAAGFRPRLIKGNVNSKGERIYHMPGQHYYNKTQIDENKGERWFCSEQEAIAAGWRKAKV